MPADIENVMALGALRGIAGFPLEHPFDVLKLRAHSSPLISTYSVAKNLFQEHNIKGLYLGGYTHFAKLVVKESFRWPVVALSMKFWKRLLPEYENNHIIPKLASSVTIALFKSSVLLPVERLMVARVNEEGYRAFFKNRFSKEGISSLYKGWSIYFA
ncbi:MAG: hypothetical protein JHC93_07280, partial [Parachlamydiales bacterium]|nr:hypothetical protein [Parachlamydiales bacterium]